MDILRLKEEMLLNALVFETFKELPKAREFKLKNLKKWGFDLIFGKIEGEEGYFISSNRKVGDRFEENGERFEVLEILKELPKNKKVMAHIEMVNAKAYLFVDIIEDKYSTSLLQLPAGEVLLAFLKKHKLIKIIEAIKDLGNTARLVKATQQEGKALGFDKLPPVLRRFLRDAKKIEKEMKFGRVLLLYFGENKDKKPRYDMEWIVPTIALFDEEIAQRIDKALVELS